MKCLITFKKEIAFLREEGFNISLLSGNMCVLQDHKGIMCHLIVENDNPVFQLTFNTHLFGHFEYSKLSASFLTHDKEAWSLALHRTRTLHRAYRKVHPSMLEVD